MLARKPRGLQAVGGGFFQSPFAGGARLLALWAAVQRPKVLVTGGAGFIGSTLVKRLVLEGAEVRVIDNLWRGSLDNLADGQGRPVIDLEHQFLLADLTEYARCLELIRKWK